jgi:hypothetical protein
MRSKCFLCYWLEHVFAGGQSRDGVFVFLFLSFLFFVLAMCTLGFFDTELGRGWV